MPFQSKRQVRAAFSGGLGPEMKAKAQSWADETPDIKSLPDKAPGRGSARFHLHATRQDTLPRRKAR